MQIEIKRVYEKPSPRDGARVLVDRVWPRGVKKADAAIHHWHKEIAPSTELRKWFGHDPDRWDEFRRRYFRELDGTPAAVDELVSLAKKGRITLVFAARDERHNNAAALREYLLNRR